MINIKEAQDFINIKVDELLGSLQTFDMSSKERSKKKNKKIAFVSNSEESQGEIKENLLDDITLLSKRFNNSLKYLNRKWRKNFQDKRPDISPKSKVEV